MKKKEFKDRMDDLFPEGYPEGNREEADKLRRVYYELMEDAAPDPPGSLDDRFYEMLSGEMGAPAGNNVRRFFAESISTKVLMHSLRIAAGIALFLLGWFGASLLGTGGGSDQRVAVLEGEVRDLRETLFLTMYENNAPAETIKAVSMANEPGSIDESIISGLFRVLNSDPNNNVRLVALEALAVYADNPSVRERLIMAIPNQEAPLVQLRLAEIMIALKETRSVDGFRKILSDTKLDYSVRKQLNETVDLLL